MTMAALWWVLGGAVAQEAPVAPPVAPLVVYVVRHAEKSTAPKGDPALTEAGAARAVELARLLGEVPLTGVASTDTLRTRSTAEPTARAHGLEVTRYDAPAALAASIRGAGGAWLVVGHSNTVPALVSELAGSPPGPDLAEGEFDRLTQVVRSPSGDALVQVLRYGAPSTPR